MYAWECINLSILYTSDMICHTLLGHTCFTYDSVNYQDKEIRIDDIPYLLYELVQQH
jgi:hypothetical protein